MHINCINKEIKMKLLEMGDKIKEKYQNEFKQLKAPYVEAVLNCVPTHLRKVKAYELQFLFDCDGWFLLHCIVALLNNGKLKPRSFGCSCNTLAARAARTETSSPGIRRS